jgi:hypothetical protein
MLKLKKKVFFEL